MVIISNKLEQETDIARVCCPFGIGAAMRRHRSMRKEAKIMNEIRHHDSGCRRARSLVRGRSFERYANRRLAIERRDDLTECSRHRKRARYHGLVINMFFAYPALRVLSRSLRARAHIRTRIHALLCLTLCVTEFKSVLVCALGRQERALFFRVASRFLVVAVDRSRLNFPPCSTTDYRDTRLSPSFLRSSLSFPRSIG